MLRSHWCGILNTHTPTQDKCDGIKDIFYGELECEHDQFPAKLQCEVVDGRYLQINK
jgi:hypothetical protein